MNEGNSYARRYHWLGDSVASFINEPHSTILSQARGVALNLVAGESRPARDVIAGITAKEKPESIL
jgi:hypothetical protein